MTRRLPWSRNIDRLGTRAFRVAPVAYVGFGLLDCIATAAARAHGGHEGNRFAASLYEQYGIGSLFAFKLIIVTIIISGLMMIPRRTAVWLTTAFAGAVALAVVGNLHALSHLS